MAEVPLVDLEVIVRYSLAIRQERAPAEEVLAALDESRAVVLGLLGRSVNGTSDVDDALEDEPGAAFAEAEDQDDEARDHDLDDGGDAGLSEGLGGFDGRAGPQPADDATVADLGDDLHDDLAADLEHDLEHDLEDEVRAAEDAVALDDLGDSGRDVDGTPGLHTGPASRRQPVVRRRERLRPAVERQIHPPPAAPPRRQEEREEREERDEREERAARAARAERPPKAPRNQPQERNPFEPDEDQEWMDEVERIRQRRIRKARLEAEERQARQAELARKARLARQAEEEEEAEARRIQQERRAARGLRAEQEPARDQRSRPEAGPPGRPSAPAPRRRDLDDALELPQPLPSDVAARRREERRRRRAREQG